VPDPSLVQDVLSFWFGAAGRPREEWFRASDAFDAEIRSRFGEALERAARGDLDDWRSTPRGRLALVVLLDQFSRNAFRGKPSAFALDPRARALALEGIDAGEDRGLPHLERSFLYMPLMHAEDTALQDRSVALFEELARAAPPELAGYLESGAKFARAHRDIVARFSRFPHRNAILGRESTAAEAEFLRQPRSAF
jgi:uncharacterized protein (DUF924 family)